MTEAVLSVGFVVTAFVLPVAIAIAVIALLLLASSAAAPIFKKWRNPEEIPDSDPFIVGLYEPPEDDLSTSLAIRRAGFRPF